MSEQIETGKAPVAAAVAKGPADLSSEIERSIDKEPKDRVRCVRVFGDYYRCNWWAPPVSAKTSTTKTLDWGMSTTHLVRKSSFLTATMNAGKLVIEFPTKS